MKKFELKRKLFHMFLGLFFILMVQIGVVEKIGSLFPLKYIYFMPELARPLLLLLCIGLVLLILSDRYEIRSLEWLLENFERRRDRREFPGKGAFAYTLSAFAIAVFLNAEILSASIFILAVGDSVSYIVGVDYGRVRHPLSNSKNIEGTIAGGILGGLGASLFVSPTLAFSSSLIAMFVEGIEFGGRIDWVLEDNFVVPIVSAIVIVSLNSFL